MKELREKMKADAVSELTELVDKGSVELGRLANPIDGLDRYSLARLIVGGRTASIEKAVISRMVKAKGLKLLDQYKAQQQELPLDEESEARDDTRRRGRASKT